MSFILIVSVLILLISAGWSVVLLWRFRDWRIGFLVLLFGLMALDQTLTVLATRTSWTLSLVGFNGIPGLLGSILALLMLLYFNRFITRQKQGVYDPDRLIALIENSTDFIGLATLTGHVTYINPAGLRLVGLDGLDAAQKLRTEEFVLEEDRQELIQEIQPALMKAGNWRGKYLFRHFKGAPPILFEINAFLVRDPETRLPMNIAIVNRDITERTKIEEEREQLIEELEMHNAELERFTYTVSHDLKTSLVTIKGFLGLLQKDLAAGDTHRVEGNVAQISSSADKMARLLKELLELSRIGRQLNPPEVIDLADLVDEAIDLVAGPIDRQGVKVEIDLGIQTVQGDRLRLLEVYQNLIDNSFKFMGDQANPRVKIGAEQRDGEAVCFVQDNGSGIPATYHEKVFELFERLDATTDGTGIGLALVKRIVGFHGGRTWVVSDGAGQGATFYFTLPKTLLS